MYVPRSGGSLRVNKLHSDTVFVLPTTHNLCDCEFCLEHSTAGTLRTNLGLVLAPANMQQRQTKNVNLAGKKPIMLLLQANYLLQDMRCLKLHSYNITQQFIQSSIGSTCLSSANMTSFSVSLLILFQKTSSSLSSSTKVDGVLDI